MGERCDPVFSRFLRIWLQYRRSSSDYIREQAGKIATALAENEQLPANQPGYPVVDWPSIVEQHGPAVWHTAYRLLGDRDQANDCYQETFLQAVEFSRQRPVYNWPGLLKQIATARALDQLRRRYRNDPEPLDNGVPVIGREPPPDRRLQQGEWLDQLRGAVANLPERQARVFWLSEIEQMSHADIATHLEADTGQVATLLHRAKRKLRRRLAEMGMVGEVAQ